MCDGEVSFTIFCEMKDVLQLITSISKLALTPDDIVYVSTRNEVVTPEEDVAIQALVQEKLRNLGYKNKVFVVGRSRVHTRRLLDEAERIELAKMKVAAKILHVQPVLHPDGRPMEGEDALKELARSERVKEEATKAGKPLVTTENETARLKAAKIEEEKKTRRPILDTSGQHIYGPDGLPMYYDE